jgi:mannose-6-phosphate isomerase-like protein (cupin superfamily)
MPLTDLVYTQNREDAQVPWFLGVQTPIRATGDQTKGAYSLFEQILPLGVGMPLHMHHNEDETFYVVDGNMTIWVGGKRIDAKPGTWVFAPRDVPHAFRGASETPARVILSLNPSGFEFFIYALGEKTEPTAAPDMDHVIAVAKQHGVEIIGGFPE